MTALRVAKVDLRARAALEAALLNRRRGAESIRSLPRTPGETHLPASVSQEGMWAEIQHEPEPSPVIVGGARLRGPLDVPALTRAWRSVVARHETLRTALRVEDGRLTQVIAESVELPLPVTDITIAEFAPITWAEVDRPVELTTGPLARLRLLRVAQDDHIALLVLHHLIGDARAIEVLVRDLGAYYLAEVTGEPARLPPLTVQYADFAAWHRNRLTGPAGAELIDYWVRRLDGATPAELPTDLEPPAHPSARGDTLTVPIEPTCFAGMVELAKARRTTLYIVGLAAFTVQLARYSGQRDISVRAPVSYRDRSEVQDLIADFSNDVIIRTDLTANPTFAELIEAIRDQANQDFVRHDLPPHLLAPRMADPDLLGRLFQVQFTVEQEVAFAPRLGPVAVERLAPPWQYALRPLAVRIRYDEHGATCLGTYRTEQFSPERVRQILDDYFGVVGEMLADPNQKVTP
ncbi:MAG TPA: condensation domain-containing protein [Pseudonocardiaceae bacterium]